MPVQVCWAMDTEATRQREIKALLKACSVTNSKKGFIITFDTEETFDEDGVNIEVVSAWKFCAQEFDLFNKENNVSQ